MLKLYFVSLGAIALLFGVTNAAPSSPDANIPQSTLPLHLVFASKFQTEDPGSLSAARANINLSAEAGLAYAAKSYVIYATLWHRHYFLSRYYIYDESARRKPTETRRVVFLAQEILTVLKNGPGQDSSNLGRVKAASEEILKISKQLGYKDTTHVTGE